MTMAVDPRTLAAYVRVLAEYGALSSFELTPEGGIRAAFSGPPRVVQQAAEPAPDAPPTPTVPDGPPESGWDLVVSGTPIEARWVPPETTTTEDDVAVEPPAEEG